MEPRQITVSLRRDPREIAEKHSQANPLTLRCELARGETVTEALNLYAELHASRTPQSSPLASAGPVAMSAASEGPWDLDFSAAQMNQTVLPGEDREFWLVVYATGANDLLLTLGTIRLTLAYDNISQVTPAPPEPALILAFRTIAVAGQDPIVADTSADTLTITAGNGIVLTTNPATDTLTITAAGGAGSGDVTGPNGATDNALARFDGTTGKIIQSSTATLSDAGALAVTDATVSGTLTAPHIHGNLAGAVYSHIRNESGGVLSKGTPVYVTGYSVGQARPLVAAANAASAATMPAIGILDEELANNASGHCVISGNITDLNTAAYTVNAPLYVAIGGGLTATAPSVRAQPIAIVERVNANNGSIIVTPAATVGSLANQSAANVAITGGSITGITDLAVADGGTGASTASVALSNLGGYPASNPNGYTSNAGTVTNVTGTAPIVVTNGTTTPAITVATFGTSNSGVVPASGGGTSNFLRADGSWAAPPGGTGGAPTDADYLVRTANGSLSAERVVGDSTTVTANWTTAGQVSFERAALTGDVTASANSNTTTIANDAVTYAKIQSVTTARLLGRASAGSGTVEEITLGNALSFSSGALTVSGFLTGSLDNGALRADGNGGATLQSSDLIIEDVSTTTQNNLALTNNHSGQTNSSFVVTPKGTGAFLLGPRPDGSVTGGNARGLNAVDLQMTRFSATQVASGRTSFCAGYYNTASGASAAAFGEENTASSTASFACGAGNISSGPWAAAFGVSTRATTNTAVSFGNRSDGIRFGMIAQAYGNFTVNIFGEAQRGMMTCRQWTVNNTPKILTLEGGVPSANGVTIGNNNRIVLQANSTLSATVNFVARQVGGVNHASFSRRCLVQRGATLGSVAIVDTVQSIGTDIKPAGASSWDATLVADTDNGALNLQVTGSGTSTAYTGATSSSSVITAAGSAPALNDPVTFTALTGGSGVSLNVVYFVVSPSGSTFRVAATPGGAALTLGNYTNMDLTLGGTAIRWMASVDIEEIVYA